MLKQIFFTILLIFPLIAGAQTAGDGHEVVFDADEMLERVNEARLTSQKCGDQKLDPTHPLEWNDKLARAAQKHANDMADNDFFDHTGSDDSSVSVRVDREGYVWRTVGENVAMGPRSVKEVVIGWLASPGHCSNIMNPAFAEMGAALSHDGKYWVQVFAAPR